MLEGERKRGEFQLENDLNLLKFLRESDGILKASKECSCKDSEVIRELNTQCKEKDLVIKTLEEEVAKLVNERDKAYASGRQALLVLRSNMDLLNTLNEFLCTYCNSTR